MTPEMQQIRIMDWVFRIASTGKNQPLNLEDDNGEEIDLTDDEDYQQGVATDADVARARGK